MATRIPLSIDPRIIAQHHARDPRTRLPLPDETLAELQRAFQRATDTAQKIEEAVAAIMNDQSRPVAQRAIDAKKVITTLAEQATKHFDAAKTKAAKELEAIAKATAPPPETSNAAEIRQALRGLSREDRNRIIAAAVENNEAPTVSAMVGAAPWLSGLSDAERDMRLQAWRSKHHAEQYQREARLKAAMEDFERGGRALVDYVVQSIPDAQKHEAAANAANAAIENATKQAIEDKQAAAE